MGDGNRYLGARELLEEISARGAVLYGTGFVADMFYKALEEYGLSGKVRFCVVSGTPSGDFHGRPVYSLEACAGMLRGESGAAPLLCVAVHEALRPEIDARLQEAGIHAYVWIPRTLQELLWGPAVQESVRIPLKDLLKMQEEDQYWVTVRYAAMRELLQDAGPGTAFETYLKIAGLFSSRDTAEKRLRKAVELARSMRENGFDEACPVLLDTRYHILDGLHRVAAAALTGQETVPCRIVNAGDRFERYLTENNRATADAQERAGLTRKEKRMLRETRAGLLESGKVFGKPEISVIIPVYNVEKYIDQCMESVVAQTFPDFEILLINDGSSDGSPGKCMEWDRKDGRVIVFDRPNGGVASARNFGIDMARGEYLAFVDPDDWLDVTYLEKLRRAAKKADADYAECDIWRYDNRTGTQIHRSCGSRMGLAYTLREHMKYGPTATYKAISRRRLWTGNGVRMPDCSFESPAVYSLMLALSNRIVNVSEPLYFYRRFRENSLIENGFAGQDGVPDPVLGLEAMDFLTGEFRRTGLYETYADTLEGIVKYRLSDILAMQFHRKPQDEFRALVRNYRAFLGKTFPEGHNEPYITWGGYNLNRILTHMDWLHDPYGRFNFSSILSLAGAPASRFEVTHKNRYRRMMMEREFRQTFPEILRELRPGYLFMDFIEERFDVLALGDAYLTVSDALEEAVFRDAETGEETDAAGLLAQGRVITRGTEACTLLWQAAFRRFTETVRQAVPGIRFVIVENYLSPYVGDLERLETHPNLGQIQLWNGILMGCYNYARTYLTDAVVVSPSRDTLYYTDSRYEYGAVPQHLNEIENQYIAERIERALCPTD